MAEEALPHCSKISLSGDVPGAISNYKNEAVCRYFHLRSRSYSDGEKKRWLWRHLMRLLMTSTALTLLVVLFAPDLALAFHTWRSYESDFETQKWRYFRLAKVDIYAKRGEKMVWCVVARAQTQQNCMTCMWTVFWRDCWIFRLSCDFERNKA